MHKQRLSIRVDKTLQKRLEIIAQDTGKTESEIVRDALDTYLAQSKQGPTCFEVAKRARVIGCVSGGPRDVSTNPKYMEGFGRD